MLNHPECYIVDGFVSIIIYFTLSSTLTNVCLQSVAALKIEDKNIMRRSFLTEKRGAPPGAVVLVSGDLSWMEQNKNNHKANSYQ